MHMGEEIITITPFVNAKILHCFPVAPGSDLFRVIFDLIATQPPSEEGKLFKSYEVWVTRSAVEDIQRLKGEALQEDIKKFAIELLQGRCKDENGIPSEDGVYIPTASEKYVGNPRTFPLDPSVKPKLIKTTIMLSEETHRWLRNYGHQKNIGLGEAIRRVVSDFQAGTITPENVDQTNVIDNSGVPNIKK